MSDDTQTTQVLRRRATDAESKQRIWTGWIGLALATVACLTGLWRDNNILVLGGFLGAMVAGNRLPFSAVRDLLPRWGSKS